MTGRFSKPARLLVLFGVLSLAAVATGALVSASSGVPAAAWARNLAAWVVGALAGIVIARTMRPGFLPVALWIAPAGLLATFSPNQQGVHRWVDLGPLHANVAMFLLPAAIVALAASAWRGLWPWIAALLSLGLLVAQPDASQATALGVVAVLIAAVAVRPLAIRAALIGAAGVLTALAWLRPDPLQPVAEVEQIIKLAFALSPVAAGVAVLLLLAVAASPAVATYASAPELRLAGSSLGLCFLVWVAAPFLGAFPVPLVGIGVGPIIGSWLGIGLLAGLLRSHDAPSSPFR